jgi:undecaprenyl-diphosphatase
VRWQSFADLRTQFVRFEKRELELVRRMAAVGERPWIRPATVVLNRLADGLLYAVIVAALLWFHPPRVFDAILAAGLAAAAAHIIYPAIKRFAARPRPYDIDPSLKPMLRALDKYSFPSGHCMTVTCVLIPLTVAFPEFSVFVFAALLWLLIAWARLASAHHYPSDLLAGTALGLIVAAPITLFLI